MATLGIGTQFSLRTLAWRKDGKGTALCFGHFRQRGKDFHFLIALKDEGLADDIWLKTGWVLGFLFRALTMLRTLACGTTSIRDLRYNRPV